MGSIGFYTLSIMNLMAGIKPFFAVIVAKNGIIMTVLYRFSIAAASLTSISAAPGAKGELMASYMQRS